MGTILEAQAIVKAKDATGGVFEAIAQKVQRLNRAAQSLNRDVQKQLDIGRAAEQQIGRIEQRASRMQRLGGAISTGAKMAVAAGAAYQGAHLARSVLEKTVNAGSDRAHEEVRQRVSGMSDKEIAEAEDLARATSAKYKSVSTTEIMHAARNVRSVVGTFEEATKIIDPLMKLRVVAQGAHPERSAELGEDFDKLIKGMEIKGVTQDHAKFEHYIDNMARAINVFGDTLRPTDYYEMFKYGRAATNALGDQFMLETAPTLAQELGGNSAGTALSGFHTQFVGGKMSNRAVEMLNDLGLIDPDKVIKTSTGAIKGVKPGGVIGGGFLTPGSEDPYQWVNKVLLPAMQKKGMTTEQINQAMEGISEPLLPKGAKEQEIVAAAASKQTVAQMMSIFATQQGRIEKDWALIKGAKGIEGADDFLQHDPKVAQEAVKKQIENYFGETGKPLADTYTGGLNWLASGMNYMSNYAKDNPARNAAGLGWLGTMSAALSADGTISLLNGMRAGDIAGNFKLGLSKLGLMMAPIVDIATRQDVLPGKFRRGYQFDEDKFGRLIDIDQQDKALPTPHNRDNWFGRRVWAMRDANAKERAEIEAQLSDKGYAPPGVPGRGLWAGSYTVDDLQKALGISAGTQEPAKAEVVGNATLETTVKVEPSPLFQTMVDQRIDNKINAFRSSGQGSTGTTGSTGKTMPEATAPQ
ncbi:hypothetical protein [Bradyrhizobium sp. SZCCHNR2023]|uniref:hypothetical protein n=1 Tax=Bradyrhizobium sp. SZCCHNR2023 TaxID=3057380 RepID=UPI002916FA85|nr:hypothetical protein [Bradyrhizobium sp. SZCCHNR2023]